MPEATTPARTYWQRTETVAHCNTISRKSRTVLSTVVRALRLLFAAALPAVFVIGVTWLGRNPHLVDAASITLIVLSGVAFVAAGLWALRRPKGVCR